MNGLKKRFNTWRDHVNVLTISECKLLYLLTRSLTSFCGLNILRSIIFQWYFSTCSSLFIDKLFDTANAYVIYWGTLSKCKLPLWADYWHVFLLTYNSHVYDCQWLTFTLLQVFLRHCLNRHYAPNENNLFFLYLKKNIVWTKHYYKKNHYYLYFASPTYSEKAWIANTFIYLKKI